jgi:hypothetical protein
MPHSFMSSIQTWDWERDRRSKRKRGKKIKHGCIQSVVEECSDCLTSTETRYEYPLTEKTLSFIFPIVLNIYQAFIRVYVLISCLLSCVLVT